jgi:hypothetical protein
MLAQEMGSSHMQAKSQEELFSYHPNGQGVDVKNVEKGNRKEVIKYHFFNFSLSNFK